jgi:hypothetical protein
VFELSDEAARRLPNRFNEMMLGIRFGAGGDCLEGYDANFHFLLARLPYSLGGISGCRVWQAGWPGGGWSPDAVRVVGVETSYYRAPIRRPDGRLPIRPPCASTC